ncbi:MAG: carbonic anhydrase [Pseudohongiellaceae bacterium]|nr:carbonic anhydrase [Pseudohongiellaceae bacterium]
MSDDLFAGYQRFKNGYFADNRNRLKQLAEQQKPKYVLITCCDARMEPALIFDSEPGDLFVIRNVANLVPPNEIGGSYHGTSAALEFAITALEVPEIVVLGHTRCGGIHSLVTAANKLPEESFISRWMSIASPIAELVDPSKLDDPATFDRCEQAAISFSLENLMTYPWIKSRVDEGKLKLTGLHYNIATGALKQILDRDHVTTIVEEAKD